MIFFVVKPNPDEFPYFSDDVLKYLIPTAVTLFVFALGLITNGVKSNWERRRNYKQLKGLFVTWIPNFKKPVEKFAANCDDFSNRLKSSVRISSESMKFIPLNAIKLADIDINQLVKTFIYNSTGNSKLNNENLYYMVSNLEYLVNLGSEMKAKYDEHYTNANSLMKEWNAAFTELSDLHSKVLTNQSHKSVDEQVFHKALVHTIDNWLIEINARPQDATITYNKLLIPNLQLFNEYLKQLPLKQLPLPEQLLMDLLQAYHKVAIIYKQWQASKDGYAIIFTNYGLKLHDTYQRLQESINYFEKSTRINWICR